MKPKTPDNIRRSGVSKYLSLRWHYPNQVLGRNFWFPLSLHHKLPIIEMNCSMIWKNSSGNSGFMIYLPRPSAGSASAAFPPAVSALGAFGLSGSKKECPFLRLRNCGEPLLPRRLMRSGRSFVLRRVSCLIG